MAETEAEAETAPRRPRALPVPTLTVAILGRMQATHGFPLSMVTRVGGHVMPTPSADALRNRVCRPGLFACHVAARRRSLMITFSPHIDLR